MASWELISKHFDVMGWWQQLGKTQFPLIYIVACLIIAMPDSNGAQKRTFSSATWMDDKLKKRQSDLTFQMKVLLYKNKDLLQLHRHLVSKDRKKAATARVKKVLEQSIANTPDVDSSDSEAENIDLDEELNGMLEAYETPPPDPTESPARSTAQPVDGAAGAQGNAAAALR